MDPMLKMEECVCLLCTYPIIHCMDVIQNQSLHWTIGRNHILQLNDQTLMSNMRLGNTNDIWNLYQHWCVEVNPINIWDKIFDSKDWNVDNAEVQHWAQGKKMVLLSL